MSIADSYVYTKLRLAKHTTQQQVADGWENLPIGSLVSISQYTSEHRGTFTPGQGHIRNGKSVIFDTKGKRITTNIMGSKAAANHLTGNSQWPEPEPDENGSYYENEEGQLVAFDQTEGEDFLSGSQYSKQYSEFNNILKSASPEDTKSAITLKKQQNRDKEKDNYLFNSSKSGTSKKSNWDPKEKGDSTGTVTGLTAMTEIAKNEGAFDERLKVSGTSVNRSQVNEIAGS